MLLAVGGYLGLTVALGAHPYWGMQVVWVGIGIGAVIFGLSRLWRGRRLMKLGLALVFLALSAGVVGIGKARFVVSYGDDFLAGRMWYFGWMAVVAFAFVLLAQLMAQMMARRG